MVTFGSILTIHSRGGGVGPLIADNVECFRLGRVHQKRKGFEGMTPAGGIGRVCALSGIGIPGFHPSGGFVHMYRI